MKGTRQTVPGQGAVVRVNGKRTDLHENRQIQTLRGIDASCLPCYAQRVLAKIRAHDPSWEEMVPAQVARMIKARRLFNDQPC